MDKISRRTVLQGLPAIAVGAMIPAANAWAAAEGSHIKWPIAPGHKNWIHFVTDPDDPTCWHVFVDAFDYVPLIPEDIEPYMGSIFLADGVWVFARSYDDADVELHFDTRLDAMRTAAGEIWADLG